MNEREEREPSVEELAAREAVRGLSRPRADEAFRDRLKREFVSGALGEHPAASKTPSAPRRIRPRALWAVAAAAALALVIGALNRGPVWRPIGTSGEGTVLLGDERVPIGEIEDLAGRLRSGMRIQIPQEAELQVASGRGIVIQATPRTDFTLPGSPGRWLGRDIAAHIIQGELRITTGPAFRGARLTIDTPEARVEVVGTTLAVIRDSVSTCVCAYEGIVRIGARGEELTVIPIGMRRFIYNDGRPPMLSDLPDMERMKLGMLRDQHRPLFEGGPAR